MFMFEDAADLKLNNHSTPMRNQHAHCLSCSYTEQVLHDPSSTCRFNSAYGLTSAVSMGTIATSLLEGCG